jgi:hypothetical protein
MSPVRLLFPMGFVEETMLSYTSFGIVIGRPAFASLDTIQVGPDIRVIDCFRSSNRFQESFQIDRK